MGVVVVETCKVWGCGKLALLPVRMTLVSCSWTVVHCSGDSGTECSPCLWKDNVLDCEGMLLCLVQVELLEYHRASTAGSKN